MQFFYFLFILFCSRLVLHAVEVIPLLVLRVAVLITDPRVVMMVVSVNWLCAQHPRLNCAQSAVMLGKVCRKRLKEIMAEKLTDVKIKKQTFVDPFSTVDPRSGTLLLSLSDSYLHCLLSQNQKTQLFSSAY